MAITAMAVATSFFLLVAFSPTDAVTDAASFFFDVRKCTTVQNLAASHFLRTFASPDAAAVLLHLNHTGATLVPVFFDGRRLPTIQHLHSCLRKLNHVRLAVSLMHPVIHNLGGGDEADAAYQARRTRSLAIVDAVHLINRRLGRDIPALILLPLSVKNLKSQTKSVKSSQFRHVLSCENETLDRFDQTPLHREELDFLQESRRRVLELSDFHRSAAEIVTVPSTFPGKQAAAASAPTSTPTVTVPSTTPAVSVPGMTPAVGGGKVWCIAKNGVMQVNLQGALDYACGVGGADCSLIQPGGSCYNPNTIQNHASYAFNMYYQRNPSPESCNFGGSAQRVYINPSTETCVYPSSSSPSPSSSSPSSPLSSSASPSSPETPSPFPPPPRTLSGIPSSSSTPPLGAGAGGGVGTSSADNGTSTATIAPVIGAANSQPQSSFDDTSGNVARGRAAMKPPLFLFLVLVVASFVFHHPCEADVDL